jgi:hypothetical protein
MMEHPCPFHTRMGAYVIDLPLSQTSSQSPRPIAGVRPAHKSSRARVSLFRVRSGQREQRCQIEQAVLITGVYGSGKSSVAEEMAAVLEEHNAPYALLDLDFLAWFDTGGEDGPTEHRMMLTNLAAVVGNYLAVGVRFFILAKAVRDAAELEDLKAGLPMPLKVVRLTVPMEEIESGSATT